jgi:hypothetical protein
MFLVYFPLWNDFFRSEPVPLVVTAVPSLQEIFQRLDGPLGDGPCPSLTRRIDGRARHGHGEQPYVSR